MACSIRAAARAPSSGSVVPKTCPTASSFLRGVWDRVRHAKADFQLVLLLPGIRAWLRYRRSLPHAARIDVWNSALVGRNGSGASRIGSSTGTHRVASARKRRAQAQRRDGRKFGRDQNQRMGKRRVGHLLSARCQRLPAAKSLRRSGRGGRRLRLRRRRLKP